MFWILYCESLASVLSDIKWNLVPCTQNLVCIAFIVYLHTIINNLFYISLQVTQTSCKSRLRFTAEFKLEVIELAERLGNNRGAARFFDVNEKQVRFWRKSKDRLMKGKVSAFRCVGAGLKPKYPDLEQQLILWLKEDNQRNRRVTVTEMRHHAQEIAQDPSFVASDSWVKRFRDRHSDILRDLSLGPDKRYTTWNVWYIVVSSNKLNSRL